MKEPLIIVVILIVGIIGCKPIESIELDYCEMLKRDQSYVDHDEEDNEVRAENRRKRRDIFVENFDDVISLTKKEGFPGISKMNSPQDSCRNWAVTMTFIHMAQSKPQVFFSEEIISLFKEEMKKGNAKQEDLAPAFRVSFMTNEFCNELRDPIQKAIVALQIESKLLRKPKFKECN